MRIGSLFSGIGGLELGLERSGLGHVVWQAEIDPFCRAVLAKHWPDAKRYEDVREVGHGAARVDVVCGGFPCQDVSLAGKRGGLTPESRSGLWAEFERVVCELQPKAVVIENVLGLRTLGLRRVLADLAALGFDAEWACIQVGSDAVGEREIHLGGPHRRQRLFIVATDPKRVELRFEPGWFGRVCWQHARVSRDSRTQRAVADTDTAGRDARRESETAWAVQPELAGRGDPRTIADADGEGEPQQSRPIGVEWRRSLDGDWRPPVSPIRRVDDGIPRRLHGRRLKALGNAVSVPCAELVGRALKGAIQTA